MSSAPVESKVVKKQSVSKPKPNHPVFALMITNAIRTINEKSGSSTQAIHKFIAANYQVDFTQKLEDKHFKLALKKGTDSGHFRQVKGSGLIGSFKIGEATLAADKVAAKQEKKKAKEEEKKAKEIAKVDKKKVKENVKPKKVTKTTPKVAKLKVVKKSVKEDKPKKNVHKPVAVKAIKKKIIIETKKSSAKKTDAKKPILTKKTVKMSSAKKVVA